MKTNSSKEIVLKEGTEAFSKLLPLAED